MACKVGCALSCISPGTSRRGSVMLRGKSVFSKLLPMPMIMTRDTPSHQEIEDLWRLFVYKCTSLALWGGVEFLLRVSRHVDYCVPERSTCATSIRRPVGSDIVGALFVWFCSIHPIPHSENIVVKHYIWPDNGTRRVLPTTIPPLI